MQVDALRHQDGPGVRVQEGAGGLEEEERFFGGCITELFDVGGIVAANAGDCAGGAEDGSLRRGGGSVFFFGCKVGGAVCAEGFLQMPWVSD